MVEFQQDWLIAVNRAHNAKRLQVQRKLYKPHLLSWHMGTHTTRVNVEDLSQLKRDVAMIKNILIHTGHEGEDDEGELTDWAKKELGKARSQPDNRYTSLAKLKKELLA